MCDVPQRKCPAHDAEFRHDRPLGTYLHETRAPKILVYGQKRRVHASEHLWMTFAPIHQVSRRDQVSCLLYSLSFCQG